jgi:hypothetical protein
MADKEKRAFWKATRAKVDARKKKTADKAEKEREKEEKKPEISLNVHRVRIVIELPSSDLTAQESGADTAEVFQEATLTLTYTTTSASWTPHYDLRLDTTNPALSSLTYRAHFTNRTYETWSQAAITLSTSQASFGGLKEKIPQMEGWRVTLAKKWNNTNAANGENGLYSLAELKAKKEAEQKEYGIDVIRERDEWLEESKTGGLRKKAKQLTPSRPPVASAMPARSMRFRTADRNRSQEYGIDVDEGPDFGLVDDGDGATLAPGAQAMQHSLVGSDTYGRVFPARSPFSTHELDIQQVRNDI